MGCASCLRIFRNFCFTLFRFSLREEKKEKDRIIKKLERKKKIVLMADLQGPLLSSHLLQSSLL